MDVWDGLSADHLDYSHLIQLRTNQCLQTRHALVGIDGANAHPLHGLAVVFVGRPAYVAPISPVHNFYRVRALLLQALRKAVFESRAGGIRGLAGGLDKRDHGREEEHEIQLLLAEYPVHIDAYIDFAG